MADNVQIVLNAFETLFNKRDYAAAERFWSPNYQARITGAAAEIAGVAGVAAADVDDAAPARRLHERDNRAGTA